MMSNLIFMILGGMIAGLFGSVLGLGGGVLIIPMLNLIFGVPMREAIGASLVCVIATSSGAASLYVKKRLADIRLGMTLELATTLGAIVGGLVAGILTPELLSVLFSLLLIYTAGTMFRKKVEPEDSETSNSQSLSDEGASPGYQVCRLPLGMGASFFAGNVSGLLGVGGGIIKVPVMYLFMGVPLKVAVATSNFMIGVTATASAFVYFSRGDVQPLVAGPTMLGVFLGATLGSHLFPKIKSAHLEKALAFVLFGVALEMLFKALGLHFWF
jgi:uncharacterized membrane protein YfcA